MTIDRACTVRSMADDDRATSTWRALLTGEDPSIRMLRGKTRRYPDEPEHPDHAAH